MSRKYLDVYELLDANPGMTPAEAGRQLGYETELHWKSKKDRRVGPKHRHSDGQRALSEQRQRIGPKNIPPSQPGFDRHHKRMVMLYKPLYEGLSEADALKLSQHALDVGMPLGDVGDNYQLLPKEVHNNIHRYMEREGMRPSQMPDFSKADLSNRIKAFDALYKDFLQPDIDKQTNLFQQQYSSKLTSIQDVLNSRRAIKTVSAASFVPGVLGTAADVAETTMRTELARQTGNPVDYLQAAISGASTSLGLTNIGDVIGIPLEILNSSIDQHREGLPQIRGRSGAQKAQKRDLE